MRLTSWAGSVLQTSANLPTGKCTSFTVREDTVIETLAGVDSKGNLIDFKTVCGLASNPTLKQGTLIIAPLNSFFTRIVLAQGSIVTDGWAANNTDIADVYYQRVLDFATQQGYTLPSDEYKEKGINMIKNLLDLDFALIDWINPSLTTNASLVGDTFFTPLKGFNNISTGYINTNYSSFVNYKEEDAGWFFYVNDIPPAASVGRFVGWTIASYNNKFSTSNNMGVFLNGGVNAGNIGGYGINTLFQFDRFNGEVTGSKNGVEVLRNANTLTSLPSGNCGVMGITNGSNILPGVGIEIFSIGGSAMGKQLEIKNIFETYKN